MDRTAWASRPRRESLSKRLGKLAGMIKARDGHSCVYCGATASSSGFHLHLDHLRPRVRGGEDVPSNLVTACRSCNCRRGSMPLASWARVAGTHLRFTAASVRAQARRPLKGL